MGVGRLKYVTAEDLSSIRPDTGLDAPIAEFWILLLSAAPSLCIILPLVRIGA